VDEYAIRVIENFTFLTRTVLADQSESTLDPKPEKLQKTTNINCALAPTVPFCAADDPLNNAYATQKKK
jgi:hypothetical protein